MIDYKNALNLIDHTLLIQKLWATSINNDYVSLFESYLSDRTQYVNMGVIQLSEVQTLECLKGVS